MYTEESTLGYRIFSLLFFPLANLNLFLILFIMYIILTNNRIHQQMHTNIYELYMSFKELIYTYNL